MAFRPVRLELAYALAASEKLKSDVASFPKKKIPTELNEQLQVVLEHYQQLKQIRAAVDRFPIRKVDQALDRMVAHFSRVVESVINAYEPCPLERNKVQESRWLAATKLRALLFPDGVRAITALAYIQEWEAVQNMLAKVASNKELTQAIQALGLESEMEMLQRLHELYGETLGITKEKNASSESYRLSQWYDSYQELMVVASYLGRTNPELASLVFLPYDEQVEKQSVARIRQRRKNQSDSELDTDTVADGNEDPLATGSSAVPIAS
jgi:hypothetical protein